ncbi:response regulator [Horticoccus luteus]|uniref:Response regulator n=1 Tax=Horticoccus luteus TaxID=2862869 RepID=A0A8F9TUP9_9BACT|nr:response regulator [Horticoccus luteus]QYM78123.1 response regulator [Horticoccus luteus]
MSLAASPPQASVAASRFYHILVVDDLPELCELAARTLTRAGHHPVCVQSGSEALACLAADPHFDIIMTDHHMPLMTGLELVARLHELHFPGRIIATTADPDPALLSSYCALGVDSFLPKPASAEEIQAAISACAPAA